MWHNIVVFERDERHTDSDAPELDSRIERQALPAGAAPVAFRTDGQWTIWEAQWFTVDEVRSWIAENFA